MGRIMIRLVFGEEMIIVTKEEIMRILFHRGDKLLLDEVIIAGGRAYGTFTVTEQVCRGHEPTPGMPVMQGVLMIEMAFQLIGILVAKHPDVVEFLKNKVPFARENGKVSYDKFARPGDKLEIRVSTEEVNVTIRSTALKISSGRMVVSVGREDGCIIDSATIAFLDQSVVNRKKQ